MNLIRRQHHVICPGEYLCIGWRGQEFVHLPRLF